jgi:hypothetical protein
MACAGQVRMLGVQRKEHLIGRYSLVERIDEALKESRATGLICSDSKIESGRYINHGTYVRGLREIFDSAIPADSRRRPQSDVG